MPDLVLASICCFAFQKLVLFIEDFFARDLPKKYVQWRRLRGARGQVPPLLQMAVHGGHCK